MDFRLWSNSPSARGRLLVLATDLGGEWNTFPRHSAFVPFVLETLRYLTGLKSQPTDVTVAEVPPGALPRPGAARIGTPPRLVAVNVDVRESAVARITAKQLASAVRRVEPEGRAADAAARERETAQGILASRVDGRGRVPRCGRRSGTPPFTSVLVHRGRRGRGTA